MLFFHRAAAVNADSVSWVSWMSCMSWMSCNCSAGRFCVLWSPNDRCRIVSFIKIQTAPASSAQLHHRSWTCRTCRTLCGPQLGRKMLLSKGLNCQPRSGQPFICDNTLVNDSKTIVKTKARFSKEFAVMWWSRTSRGGPSFFFRMIAIMKMPIRKVPFKTNTLHREKYPRTLFLLRTFVLKNRVNTFWYQYKNEMVRREKLNWVYLTTFW